ncbi:MAG TPA: potassium transporter Kup [Sporichthyaceae bacterium]|jgi:KUP system potassium uptake protein|nr:potassium transporter Kup [Sporichthyaceae bacterium]
MAVASTTTDKPERGSHPAAHGAGSLGLALGALGVVFGDIGTSPLYAAQTVFSIDNNSVKPDEANILGVVSAILWSLVIVVTIKYVTIVLRADNDGEGGVLALAALTRRALGSGRQKLVRVVMALGVLGAALLYGDSVITPAISVLSAVEGMKSSAPELSDLVLPIAVGILVVLFMVQRWGTGQVGQVFGPIMLLWFVVITILGVREIAMSPSVLRALSPSYAVLFGVRHPHLAFIAMGAVVLAITGAEALYADMSHFGRGPIRLSWFVVCLPALTANYLGQAALLLHHPDAAADPFYLLCPHRFRLPLVFLATMATVIASQAVISGAYTLSRQAVRLGFLPPLKVQHTSKTEGGQIYLPAVNNLLWIAVLALTVAFGSSAKLATAYGLAVTGTLLLTTTLFGILAATSRGWPKWKLICGGILFGGLEIIFFGANLTKVAHGGWVPLVIAGSMIVVMTTWQRGRAIITSRRRDLEGDLEEFLDEVRRDRPFRVGGTAVFLHPSRKTAPLALRANLEFNSVLHQKVLIVEAVNEDIPHVPTAERCSAEQIGRGDTGIWYVRVRFGFQDSQDVPRALALAKSPDDRTLIRSDNPLYYVSRINIQRGRRRGLPTWRKRLFIALAHNAADPAIQFKLPVERTIGMSTQLEL